MPSLPRLLTRSAEGSFASAALLAVPVAPERGSASFAEAVTRYDLKGKRAAQVTDWSPENGPGRVGHSEVKEPEEEANRSQCARSPWFKQQHFAGQFELSA